MYADDTSSCITASTWEEVTSSMSMVGNRLSAYSKRNGLCLNEEKTQELLISQSGSFDSLELLGITFSRNLSFQMHHTNLAKDLRQRIGTIRQLSMSISRGALLNEIAHAIVIGKVQPCAWITHSVRLQPECGRVSGEIQTA